LEASPVERPTVAKAQRAVGQLAMLTAREREVLNYFIEQKSDKLVALTLNRIARYFAVAGQEVLEFDPRGFEPSLPLQTNFLRHFDPKPGLWLNEEPVANAAGETNLRKYVGLDDKNQ
jgi:hypothetical protein